MRTLTILSIILHIFIGMLFLCNPISAANAGTGSKGAIRNGDVNGSGNLDLADAVYILTYLFTDGTEPVEWTCPDDLLVSQDALVSCQTDKETLQSQLLVTQAELEQSQSDLQTCQGERDSLQTQLSSCQQDLEQSQALCELALSTCDDDKATLLVQLVECQAQNLVYEDEIWHKEQQLSQCQDMLTSCQAEKDILQAQLLACQVDCDTALILLENCQQALADSEAQNEYLETELVACQSELEECQTRVGLPATGQDSCYDIDGNVIDCDTSEYPGQDGYYQTGYPRTGRFIDNDDGTITDNATGLMWQKEVPTSGGNWQEALHYCTELELSSYHDWRLPNINELCSIVDYSGLEGSSNIIMELLNSSGYTWTSTTANNDEGQTNHALMVSFSNGRIIQRPKSDNNMGIRAVRTIQQGEYNEEQCNIQLAECQAENEELQAQIENLQDELVACQSSIGLPATGHVNCYDEDGNEINCDSVEFPGQDGLYQSGCPLDNRFLDMNDGTVMDTCTGLMWTQASIDINQDGIITEENDKLTWKDALSHCEDIEFAGHNDWRLPNVIELQGIVDYGKKYPAVSPIFDLMYSEDSEQERHYFSSTTFVGLPSEAIVVNFASGHVGPFDKLTRLYIIAVRNGFSNKNLLLDTGQDRCFDEKGNEIACDNLEYIGQDAHYNTGLSTQIRFIDNGDGTITDKSTNLMWQQGTAPIGRTHWQEALQYCENLEFAEYTDWRLPNVRELIKQHFFCKFHLGWT